VALDLDPEAVQAKDVAQLGGDLLGPGLVVVEQGPGDGTPAVAGEAKEPGRVPGQDVQGEVEPSLGAVRAARLRAGQVPGTEEPAEVGIAGPGLSQQGETMAAGQVDLGADDGFQSLFSGRLPEADCTIERITVSQGQGRVAQRHGPLHQRFRR
jgi:hypothetical protein